MMTHGVGVAKEKLAKSNKASTEAVSPKQLKNVLSSKVVNADPKRNEPKVFSAENVAR